MAEEAQYSSGPDSVGNKRKYEEPPSSTRRPTGFSAPIASSSPPSSYNSVPPPPDEIQLAKQRAQEIAARLFSATAAPLDLSKRSRLDNNNNGYDSTDNNPKGFSSAPPEMISNSAPPSVPVPYGGFQGSSKKIDIPNGRVGVIIGKGGETIKSLQAQSGAKIQVTRDADSDPNSNTRAVELMGSQEQISKAEILIREVLQDAESGASSAAPKRFGGHPGSEQFVMIIPNNKVGLVIGKGGETIKSMQAQSGARIQVIPLHPPPGDTSNERTVQIDGSTDQIDVAKQLVNEVISENRPRNSSMSGGYSQQGYQARPTSWGPPGSQMQQSGYGYVQPGAYPGPTPQYNMAQQAYAGYPSQPASGGWDQSNAQSAQQTTPGGGYDYYGQQAPAQQQPATGAAAADSTGYNYNQAPAASGYNQQGQGGYQQDVYGGYQAPQSGYGAAYDQQQQGYNSAPSYATQEGQTASYGAPGGDSAQAPTPAQSAQQGYQQPSPAAAGYPPQAGYGVAPPAAAAAGGGQTGYGPGYGAQKPTPAGYGQTQQSPSSNPGGSYAQPGYPQSQPPPAAYCQPEAGSQQRAAPASTYGGYGAPAAAYGAAASQAAGYAGAAPYNSYGGYPQQQAPATAYSAAADGKAAATPASQAAQIPKASPQS